ncbi:ATP-binding protein [Actinomadura luteofluorescens]|uniref:ATP-binding protein n=1 Tax=Actinomadura luteofluorescens TaxID=46163 RepID=UPI00364361FE
MPLTATLERQTGRLPAELTSFIGRQAELEQVRRLIDGHRLVTLTGAGGVGKTRLAVRAAGLARDAFRDGVFFVCLSDLTEPSLLAQAICEALGVGEQGDRPAAACLADHLADLRVLLVLDTCEHMVDECATLSEALLRSAPELRVLATSRQPLDVMGEYLFTVPPLGGPRAPATPSRTAGSATRSRCSPSARRRPSRDGRSLARTATRWCACATASTASRWRSSSPPCNCGRSRSTRCSPASEPICSRPSGRRTGLQRHQTLRATVDWSHALCSPEERLLWARLSVFAADFDLAAAENICSGDGLDAEHVAEVLTGLLDKSIVQRADRGVRVRYRMLDTLREYGSERLAARDGGEAGRLRSRCFEWYAGRLERARKELAGPEQVQWLEWFDCERANVRDVLGRVLPTAHPETVRGAMETLGRFWVLKGVLGEGRHWMDRLLETRDTTGPGWSGLLTMAALASTMQNDLAGGGALLERALAQAQAEGDRAAVADVYFCQGVAALFAGDFDLSLDGLDRADEIYRETGCDDVLSLLVEVFRAVVHLFENDFSAAVEHADRAVRLGEEREEFWVRSYGMLVGGLSLWLAGDLDGAVRRLRRALRTKRDLGDRLGITLGLEAIAGCLCSGGDHVRAARLLGAADRMRESTRTSWFGPYHAVLRDLHIDKTVEALGEARYRTAFEEGERLPLALAIMEALEEPAPAEPAAGADGDGASPLTERERQVAGLVAEGLSNRGIAERLTIAKRTADSHVEHILAKLGFSSRAQIAVWISERDR